MPAVSNPVAVKFSNEKVRPMADLLNTAYQSAKVFLGQWNALQMGALIPFTADVIIDGASVNGTDSTGGDGRPVINCQNAEQIFNLASMIVNVFERGVTDTSQGVNNAWVNNALVVQVNGKSIF